MKRALVAVWAIALVAVAGISLADAGSTSTPAGPIPSRDAFPPQPSLPPAYLIGHPQTPSLDLVPTLPERVKRPVYVTYNGGQRMLLWSDPGYTTAEKTALGWIAANHLVDATIRISASREVFEQHMDVAGPGPVR